jgi:hypothetical protein
LELGELTTANIERFGATENTTTAPSPDAKLGGQRQHHNETIHEVEDEYKSELTRKNSESFAFG